MQACSTGHIDNAQRAAICDISHKELGIEGFADADGSVHWFLGRDVRRVGQEGFL